VTDFKLRRALVAALALVAVPAAPAAAQPWTIGSPGLGDSLLPLAGNGGYDVAHYRLALDYDPASHVLDATAVIRARATQNLSQFDFDFRGFTISALTVDGHWARFRRDGQELIVTPRPKLRAGERFEVRVAYAGVPETVVDADGSNEGWVVSDDGATVVGEPQGSPGWFPANDNPRDKATFDFAITVPAGKTALANGVLLRRVTRGGKTTWRWREDNPMAPYLATATNGDFDLTERRTADGLPVYDAVDPRTDGTNLAREPEIVAFFSDLYGPYPFDAVGGIVDLAPDVDYSLETQTKPNYAMEDEGDGPDLGTVVHELAHQWFGDAVTLTDWVDIWLHEGFATWSTWIWDERHGGPTAQATFDDVYAQPADADVWSFPPADFSDPAELFGDPVYDRGALTLQALRQKVGDDAFFTILRTWYAEHKYGNVSTPEFITLAEQVSGTQLDRFFEVWLFDPGKPAPGSW
jgi:aminopeptidase N